MLMRSIKRFHSNWQQIKSKKSELDLKKSQLRSKLVNSLKNAVKLYGNQVHSNPMLRKVLEECRLNQVPKKLVDDVISRASSSVDGSSILLEGKYDGKFFFLVDCLSDNKARISQQIRKIFQDNNALYCSDSSASSSAGECSWMFNQSAVIEAYGRLSDAQLLLLDNAIRGLVPFFNQLKQSINQPPKFSSIFDKLKSFLSSNSSDYPSFIEPLSVDTIFEKAIDFGSEDLSVIDLDCTCLEDLKERVPTPFYSIENDQLSLSNFLPRIRSAQIISSTQHFPLLLHDLSNFKSFGVELLIHRSGIMWIPAANKFGQSVWQDFPSDPQKSKDLSNILKSLKQHEEVINVWHNIKGIYPWKYIQN